MIFEKIKSEGLAHNSYFISSKGEAAVIDPRRDVTIYLELAREYDTRIKFIFETHRNEDYVIGSQELKQVTEAKIFHGSALNFAYGNDVTEGDSFQVGSLELQIIETPGHTPESISITLKDKTVSDDVHMVFTGDALFAGEVGRTDFFEGEMRREMSEKLYESVFEKLLPLGEGVIVCPAHGAGSVCGGAIGDFEYTTIGYEKKTNPMLQLSREEFVKHKTQEELHMPPYFKRMEKYNKEGPPILHHLPSLQALSVKEVKDYRETGAQIVDVRDPLGFANGFIPGSFNVIRKGLAQFIGWFLNYEEPIILVDDYNMNLDSVIRPFIRLGYDNIAGYLRGGIASWYGNGENIKKVEMIHAKELQQHLHDEDLFLLDVGRKDRWKSGHIPGAHHIYVGELEEHLEEIPQNRNIVIYCESGYKTSLGASILKQHEYEQVTELVGGLSTWKSNKLPLEKV